MNRENTRSAGVVADWSPVQTWKELESNPKSCLIDVRTRVEWMFVGVPDLSSIGRKTAFVEWHVYPEMRQNDSFVQQVATSFGTEWPDTIFFICRSGVRSQAAAVEFSNSATMMGQEVQCFNVAKGFEGDLGPSYQRGQHNGWKFDQLPWQQS